MDHSKKLPLSNRYILLILNLIFFLSCKRIYKRKTSDSYTKIKDEKAKNIIKKTIKRVGGFDNWRRIKNLSYIK